MKTAFIGLGIMGSRMATNLIKNGADVMVFNRSQEPMTALAKEGASTTSSAAQAVKEADIIFSMLSRPEAVQEVILETAIDFMKEGAIWIDCSTVNPSFAEHSLQMANEKGIQYLEAPVAGTKPQAQNGELVFFVGGEKNLLEKVEPLLNHMGNKVLHIGQVGKASSFKMVVNMMLATGMIAFAEALKLGESLGLDREFLLNAVPNLPVAAPFTKMKAENIRNDDWDAQFPLELMYKDLHLAALSAYESNQPLPFTNAAKELFALASKNGLAREDLAAIYKLM